MHWLYSVCCVFAGCLVTASNDVVPQFPWLRLYWPASVPQQPQTWTDLSVYRLSPDWLASKLLYDWRFTANQFVLAASGSRLTTSNFIFQLNTCGYNPYETSCLTVGWIHHLHLLSVLASAFTLRSESLSTHDHNLLSQIRGFPNLEGQGPVFLCLQPGEND
jgi:hypothetical protein